MALGIAWALCFSSPGGSAADLSHYHDAGASGSQSPAASQTGVWQRVTSQAAMPIVRLCLCQCGTAHFDDREWPTFGPAARRVRGGNPLVSLPANLAPSAYTVKVGLYDSKTVERLAPSPDHGDRAVVVGRLDQGR